MFIANAKFENQFLSGISSSGDRYYRAMELSGRLSWFIVTCVIRDDGFEMLHSVCCSLDEDLWALLHPALHARVVCVQRVVASHEGDGRWEARDICRVWQATTDRGERMLVMQEADGTEFSGPFGETINVVLRQRTLVFESQKTECENTSPFPLTR